MPGGVSYSKLCVYGLVEASRGSRVCGGLGMCSGLESRGFDVCFADFMVLAA